MTNDYTKQAEQFLTDTNTVLVVEYLRTAPYFQGDKKSRDVYRFTLNNACGSYSSEFGNSMHNTEARALFKRYGSRAPIVGGWSSSRELKEARDYKVILLNKSYLPPNAYDVLACLEKYQPEPLFKEWAREVGYDDAPMLDYPKIQAIHQACLSQYAGIRRLFTDEQMEQLQEIN